MGATRSFDFTAGAKYALTSDWYTAARGAATLGADYVAAASFPYLVFASGNTTAPIRVTGMAAYNSGNHDYDWCFVADGEEGRKGNKSYISRLVVGGMDETAIENYPDKTVHVIGNASFNDRILISNSANPTAGEIPLNAWVLYVDGSGNLMAKNRNGNTAKLAPIP